MQHPTKTSIITHKHKHRCGFSLQEHGQLSAVPVTSIIVSNNLLAQSSPVNEKFWQQTSQLPNVLLPIATSDPAVGGWSVTWLLQASIIDFSPPCSHLFFLQYPMASTQRLAHMQLKLVRHLCNLIRALHLLHSNYKYYIIWCLHFLCVPLCSHYLPFIGCNSAAQQQTNSLSM